MVTVEQFTHRGIHFLNEDALVINERASLYGVLDGVSSIVPYLSDKKETGGYIAQTVKNYFESLDQVVQLTDHVAATNQKLRELMLEANINMKKKMASGALPLLLFEFKRTVWNLFRQATA